MAKPVINPNKAIAFSEGAVCRFQVEVQNLHLQTKKENVSVKKKLTGDVVTVTNVKVRGNVLIVQTHPIPHRNKSGAHYGTDDIAVTVTNPDTSQTSDPAVIAVAFD